MWAAATEPVQAGSAAAVYVHQCVKLHYCGHTDDRLPALVQRSGDEERAGAMPEYFTRAEAEAVLPQLEPILRELQELRARHVSLEERVATGQAKLLGNGHGQQHTAAHTHQMREIERRVGERVEAIAEMGALLKDIETGLVDFPTLRHGHEVYLCWRLGEPRIAWWHEIEAGFAGRQPLEDE